MIRLQTKKTITIIIISIAILVGETINGIKLPWYVTWIMLMLVVISQVRYKVQEETWNSLKTIIFIFISPYILALLFTICGGIWNDSFLYTMPRAFSLTIQQALILFIAGIMVITFEDDCVNVLADAMILSYIISIVIAIFGMGFQEIFRYLKNPYYWQFINLEKHGINYLERHDLGAAVGLVIVYQFLLSEGKKNYFQMGFLAFIAYACYKRIELFGVCVTILVGLMILKKKNKSNEYIINTIFLLAMVFCWIYIYLVGSKKIYILASALGISMRERKNLFNSVSGFYKLSLTYFGRGFGFTEKYLGSIAGSKTAYKLGNLWMGQMHNDIMRLYIELGMWGSFLWFLYFLRVVPEKLNKRFGGGAKLCYFLMMVYSYISYTMDNTLDYTIFQLSLYIIVIFGCFKSKMINQDAGCLINEKHNLN